MPTTLERAHRYVQSYPPAIEGENGDDRTYKLAAILVNDFALPVGEAWPLLLEYNQRCVPPWDELKLHSKLRSALTCEHPKPKGNKIVEPHSREAATPTERVRLKQGPSVGGFRIGSKEQLKALARSRPYGLEGLEWASERGVLVFGTWQGFECYGVTDGSRRVVEIRRVDGAPFPAYGSLEERKTHALRGSDKHWPVGIVEAQNFPAIALVEGIPDFLEAHYLTLWEQAENRTARDVRCAPVAMLSSSPAIAEDALPHFRNKHVRLFPHADQAGMKAGQRWAKQLNGIVSKIELFNFTGLRRVDGGAAKDLFDCRELDPTMYLADEGLWKLLP